MPGYKVHLVGGTSAFAALAFVTKHFHRASGPALAEWLALALLGSLFPDIDIKSKGQKIFYRVLFVLMIWLFLTQSYQAATVLAITGTIPLLVPHRGIFHKTWFLVTCAVLALVWMYRAVPYLATPFFWDVAYFLGGALSHVFLDRITTRSRS